MHRSDNNPMHVRTGNGLQTSGCDSHLSSLSQRLSIECCGVSGNSHVEALFLNLLAEKGSEVKRYRLTVEP